MQYGIVTVGKKEVPLQMGGSAALAYKEALDPLGSWTLTFGATACVVNACWLAGLSAHATATAAPLPALKLREVWAPASLAGVCYALSVIVTTLAVEKGGNALVPAQRNAVSLITSGAWGLVYYREVAGKARGTGARAHPLSWSDSSAHMVRGSCPRGYGTSNRRYARSPHVARAATFAKVASQTWPSV